MNGGYAYPSRGVGRALIGAPLTRSRSAASASMGGVEYGADDTLRAMRAYFPVALVRCRSRVGLVAAYLTGMAAGVRWMVAGSEMR
jgi:hypothetical protein